MTILAWMYEYDGCVDRPIVTIERWKKCEEPWTETALVAEPSKDLTLVPAVELENFLAAAQDLCARGSGDTARRDRLRKAGQTFDQALHGRFVVHKEVPQPQPEQHCAHERFGVAGNVFDSRGVARPYGTDTMSEMGIVPMCDEPQPERQPLTNEQIDEIGEPFGYFTYGDAQGDKRRAFVRAIESSHGIGYGKAIEGGPSELSAQQYALNECRAAQPERQPVSEPTEAQIELPNVVKTAPERIYLVIGEDCPDDATFDDDGVTWCADKIDDNSIPYVRADRAALAAKQPEPTEAQIVAGVKALREQWQQTRDGLSDHGYVECVLRAALAAREDTDAAR